MGFLIALAVFLATVLARGLSELATDELKAWVPWMTERLVKYAVARLHEEQRVRFEEEWRSHLGEMPGEVGKLIVALGFVRAAHRMSSLLHERSGRELVSEIFTRSLDVVGGGIALISFAPLLALLALVLKLDGGGPILSTDEYMGLNGTRFLLLRFRVEDAKARGCTCHPSVIPKSSVGRFLRRTDLDRLPHLWNVLRGEMSFIGPRLKHWGCLQAIAKTMPGYLERTNVKPGITGWAQVNGPHDLREELSLDLEYVRNRSLKMDVVILLRTIRAMVRLEN